jgi:plasmid maintenance system killer protein
VTFILIGSTAAHQILGDEWRTPKDIDVFTDETTGLDAFWHKDLDMIFRGAVRTATLDELYTIKLSHLYWEGKNGQWSKHMNDAWRLKTQYGARLLPDMHNVLYKIWEEKFGRKQVDLNMDKADFFDDAVPRKWDHDSIHMSVAYGDRPVYETMLKDGAEVAIDMRKVWAAPLDTQVRLFREEIFATALERKVIPSDYSASPSAAYAWALRRTITSLTKGRSARFIADNLDTFRKTDVDYVAQHKSKAHLLIPHERKAKV